MRKKRYLEKLERFEKELEFIKTHKISDEVTERALLYSLQICVEVVLDIIAMATKDLGLVVQDDYTNIEKLEGEGVLSEDEAELIRRFNGLRNAIVHRYNRLDLEVVQEGLGEVERLYEILCRLVEIAGRVL